MEFIQWCINHKAELLQIWLAIVGLASVVVKVLPPLPANSWLLPIVKFLGKFIALNKTVREEDRPV